MENLATGEYTRAGAVAYTPPMRYFFNSEPPSQSRSGFTVFAVCEYHAFNSWLVPYQEAPDHGADGRYVHGACDVCAAENHRPKPMGD